MAKFSRVRRSSAAHSSSRFCPIERVRPDPAEPSFWVQLVRGSGSLFELRVQSPAPSYPGAHALRPGTGRPRVGRPTRIATLSRLLSQHADARWRRPPAATSPHPHARPRPARLARTDAPRASPLEPSAASRPPEAPSLRTRPSRRFSLFPAHAVSFGRARGIRSRKTLQASRPRQGGLPRSMGR